MKANYYPTNHWKKASPEKLHISQESIENINKMIKEDFSHLKSLLIVKNGSIVFEKYLNGSSENTLHETACIFKSFLSAVIGISLQNNLIKSVDTKLVDIFRDEIPKNIDNNYRNVTIEHLLTKTSGIEWPPQNYEFSQEEKFDDIGLPFSLKIKNEPGKVFEYKPDPQILFYVIEKLSGIDFIKYADKHLFSPLGIKDYLWNTSFFENECLLMRTRDIAKLGYLYMNEGLWENRQLVSHEYIQESTKGHIHGNFPENCPYGYLWWVDEFEKHKAFYAGGFGGQRLYIIPDKQLIFVITSKMDKPHPENKLLVREFVRMLLASNEKPTNKAKPSKMGIKLTSEEKNKLIHGIQNFFSEERSEEIGIIAAETVLDFFH